ncbi:sensor domain-containing diguanylate cyclase [Liberiplasma polymorphum]|jgi:diguanylate cyclase (GGDEF)-like protein|uniref:sensor domain-containing diguanylate cyclase n=1 Tax=Liberiplasma polymorphum TaxID=3374570 RepID=UPI0037734C0A
MGKATVFLRELKETRTVDISESDLRLDDNTQIRWQKMLDICAEILEVPAALIMRLNENDIEVFMKSKNEENPYETYSKEKYGHGLYCETVIGNDKELLVENALEDEVWKDNPDVSLNMISYYGMPIKWKNGKMFGTICILDNKKNTFNNKYRTLLETFKDSIESDLENFLLVKELHALARVDTLTGIDNRRSIVEKLESMFHLYNRNKDPFCCVMVDINDFKKINDTYGHHAGDEVLIAFANILKTRLRVSDSVGRIGGDEFLLILRNTTLEGAKAALRELEKLFPKDKILDQYKISFSYGVAEMNTEFKSIEDMVKLADKKMLQRKNKVLQF